MYHLPPEWLQAHAAKLAEESALEALSVGKLWMWSRRRFRNGILGDFSLIFQEFCMIFVHRILFDFCFHKKLGKRILFGVFDLDVSDGY